ncbi:MAG: hypothetical protein HN584_04350 [Akkermansiaceae bacterium]|nr:hypothetical protein [Akkermansiaceae bacterium]
MNRLFILSIACCIFAAMPISLADSYVLDTNGKQLYKWDGTYLRSTSGKQLYKWDGTYIRTTSGKQLYKWDGTYLRNTSGKQLFKTKGIINIAILIALATGNL